MLDPFEACVAQNPSRIAIRFRSEEVSYDALNRRANQLAHSLRAQDLKAGQRVGLLLTRSSESVAAFLAVLKAGCVCVPLDSSDRSTRNHRIARDAELSLLISDSSLGESDPFENVPIVFLEQLERELKGHSGENLGESLAADQPAFLIYTSGSTGRPKGVVLSHGNLLHYVTSMARALELTEADTYVFRGSLALVVCARQLLTPLACGACVAMTTTEQSRDPVALLSWAQEVEATHLDHSPAFWNACAQTIRVKKAHQGGGPLWLPLKTNLRLVGTGGEPVSPESVAWFRQAFPAEVRFVNLYGQSEACGVVTVREFDPQSVSPGDAIPIGTAIDGMAVAVLDNRGEQTPIGEEGEICVSGHGLALGYYEQRDISQERFLKTSMSFANRFGTGRYYRTGDRGVQRKNGQIEFVGRQDDQVNIRGYRVELTEVEQAIQSHPDIENCVAVAGSDAAGRTRLVAYLKLIEKVPAPTNKILEWRTFCEAALPSYMIPAVFQIVDNIPLAQSGKVDRSALPRPAPEVDETFSVSNAAVTPLQHALTTLWARILGVSIPAVDQPFELLGGHSVNAVALLIDVQRELGVTLTVRLDRVLKLSVAEMADLIEAQTVETKLPRLETVQEGDHSAPLFIVHAVNGLNWFASLIAQYLPDSQTVHALYWHGNSTEGARPLTMEAYAARLADTIIESEPQGPFRLLGISFGAQLVFQLARELISRGHEPQFVGLVDENIDAHVRSFGRRRIRPESDRIDHQCIHMLRCFVPRVYPGQLFLFQSESRQADVLADRYAGWRGRCLEGVTRYEISGSHLTLMQERHMRCWALQLQEAMERAERDWSTHQQNPDRLNQLQEGLMEPDRSSPAGRIDAAQNAAKDGSLREEIKLYREAIKRDPEQEYWVYRNLAEAYRKAGQVNRATEAFKAALGREEIPLVGYRLLANQYRSLGDRKNVHHCLEQMRKICPKTAEALTELADALMDHSRFEEAERALIEVDRIAPGFIYSQVGFVRLNLCRGQVSQGIDRVTGLLRQNPNDWSLLNLYAQLLVANGSFEDSIPILEQLVRIQPNDLWLRWRLLQSSLASEAEDKSIDVLKAMAERLPRSLDGAEFVRQIWQRLVGESLAQVIAADRAANAQCQLLAATLSRPQVTKFVVRYQLRRGARG